MAPVNSYILFKRSTRIDIIFKYLYVKYYNNDLHTFYKTKYLQSIMWFNNFFEHEPKKRTPDDFIEGFNALIDSISKVGLCSDKSNITISADHNVYDGAHRFSICAAMGLEVDPVFTNQSADYNYKYFIDRGMPVELLDFAALQTAFENDNTYLVHVHSCVDDKYDEIIERIICRRGNIYYKKELPLSFNGYVNLKKVTYDRNLTCKSWVGTPKNEFVGAVNHARESIGKWKSRAYLIIADCLADVLQTKKEIRDLCDLGNYSVHITDDHSETIDLASYVFNNNSIKFLNSLVYSYDHRDFFKRLHEVKLRSLRHDRNVVITGSSVLELLGLRLANDIDFLAASYTNVNDISEAHEDQLQYYPTDKFNMVYDPLYYFYFSGYKIVTLEVVLAMKAKRGEYPKDIVDLEKIFGYVYDNNASGSISSKVCIPFNRNLTTYQNAKALLKKILIRG